MLISQRDFYCQYLHTHKKGLIFNTNFRIGYQKSQTLAGINIKIHKLGLKGSKQIYIEN